LDASAKDSKKGKLYRNKLHIVSELSLGGTGKTPRLQASVEKVVGNSTQLQGREKRAGCGGMLE